VFDAVVNFKTWTKWSPWLCSEPTADVQVTGDGRSVESVYSWQGQIDGHVEMERRNLKATQPIEDEIRFFKPFKTVSRVSFEIQPAADGSKITWHINGSLPWFMFWMRSLMESLIGMDYDRGLKMLKEWIETGNLLSKTNIRGIETVGPLRTAGVRTSAHMSNVGPAMSIALNLPAS